MDGEDTGVSFLAGEEIAPVSRTEVLVFALVADLKRLSPRAGRLGDRLLCLLLRGCRGGIGGLRLAHLGVLLLEAVDASFRIDQLLFAGEERVAARTDFHADIALMSGTRLELVSAGANDIHFFVSRVDSRFHGKTRTFFGKFQISTVVKDEGKDRFPAFPGLGGN